MKYQFAVVATLLILAGCASSSSMTSSSAPGVQIQLTQNAISPDTYYFRGPVAVQFGLQITNPTSDTLHLRRLNLSTTAPGAYSLRTGDSPMNYTIPPNGTVTVPLSAWAYSRGGFLSSTEPVNIVGRAWFDGPSGSFVKQFTQYIPQ
ncbi:MAG TPA: hypothetical protein VGS96_07045 [Thermoanaerobaculia bacterium]|jgi:hypothetical protein|nr:hypothetical protein [Thermoanaerobaculia bacterium]